MSLELPLQHPAVETLGWSLLHFVWQGLAIALLLAVLLIPLRRAAAQMRYLVECSGLLLMAACPVITWCWLAVSIDAVPGPIDPPQGVPVAKDDSATRLPGPTDNVARGLTAVSPSATSTVTGPREPQLVQGPFIPNNVNSVGPTLSVEQRWRQWAEPCLPWFVGCWLFGVSVLSVRLLLGWRFVQRIKRLSTTPAVDAWHQRCRQLVMHMRISRPVKLVESALIEVPTVIGWLRPMILFPASALAGLEPAQLEAILAHELAHIRRHDYLVNLIQTVLETLLFYHPAVWWVSKQIREEREHCCDDIAVEVCGSKVIYARALAEMEELRVSPRLTMAINSGSLLGRIQRLVYPSGVSQQSIWRVASPIGIVLAVGLLALVYLSTTARADRIKAPLKFGVELDDGVKVQLIGVSVPSDPSTWWEADGKRLPGNPLKGINPMPLKQELRQKQRFALRVMGLPESEETWVVDDESSGVSTTTIRDPHAREIMTDSFLQSIRNTATVRIGIRRGEVGPPLRIDHTGKKMSGPPIPPELAPWYDIITWSNITEVNGQTQLTLAPFDLRRRRAYPHWSAFDIDQQPIPVARDILGAQGHTLVFNLPLDRLSRFEVRLQPYTQWVTFENISLHPDVKTDVKVSTGRTPPVPVALLEDVKSSASAKSSASTLDKKVDAALKRAAGIPLIVGGHSSEQILQTVEALGQSAMVQKKPQELEQYRVLDWLDQGALYQGRSTWIKTADGVHERPSRTGLKLEPGHLLSYLAAAQFPADFKLKAADEKGELQPITVRDLIHEGQQRADNLGDMSRLLFALAYYQPLQSEWTNSQGDRWSLIRLTEYVLTRPSSNFGVYSQISALVLIRQRIREVESNQSEIQRKLAAQIDQTLDAFVKQSKEIQARDGSMLRSWSPNQPVQDRNERRNLTGGRLGGLAEVLTKEQLNEDWVQRTVDYVASDLVNLKLEGADTTGIFRSARALRLYREKTRNIKAAATTDPGEIVLASANQDKREEPFVSPLVIPQAAPAGTRVDADGQPLLTGQVQRFGSTRYRVPGWWRYVGFSADGEWIWGKADNRVFAMHRQTGHVVTHGQLPMGTGEVASVVVSPSRKLVGVAMWEDHRSSKAGTYKVVILDSHTGALKQVVEWKSKGGDTRVLAFSHDDRLMVTGQNNEVRLWNLANAQQLRTVEIHNVGFWDAAFSPSGDSISLVSYRDSFYWPQTDGAIPRVLVPKTPAVTVAYSPNGKWFATAADDQDGAYLWDAKTGDLIGRFQADGNGASPDGGLSFSADSKLLAIPATSANLVELWNPETRQRIGTLPAVQPRSVTISQDGKWLATTGGDSRVALFDLEKQVELNPATSGHNDGLRQVRFAGADSLITTGSDAALCIWEIASGKQRHRGGHGSEDYVAAMVVSPDGRTIASSAVADLGLWDVSTGRRLQTFKGHGPAGRARAIIFSADGTQIASWGDDLFVRWWDVRQGKLISEKELSLPNYANVIKSDNFVHLSGTFTADASTLFVAFEKSLFEFDAQSGKLRRSVPMPQALQLAPSPDGQWLAVSESRPTGPGGFVTRLVLLERESLKPVRHWDADVSFQVPARQAQEHATAEITEYYMGPCSFSADSKQLAWSVYGSQHAVEVADVTTGKLTSHVPLHSPTHALDFSADGKRVATGHYDTTAAIWNLADFVLKAPAAALDRPQQQNATAVRANERPADAACELSGHVLDSRGRLVKGAKIQVWRIEGVRRVDLLAGRMPTVTTNEDGAFEIGQLPAGEVRVAAAFDMSENDQPSKSSSPQRMVVLKPKHRAYCRLPLPNPVLSKHGEKYLTSGAANNSGTWSAFDFDPSTAQAAGHQPPEERSSVNASCGEAVHGIQTALILTPGKTATARSATLVIRNTLPDRLISFHRYKTREQFAFEVLQPDGQVEVVKRDIWQFNKLRPAHEMNAIYLRPRDEYELLLGDFEHEALGRAQAGVSVRASLTLFSDHEAVDKSRQGEFFPTSQLHTGWVAVGVRSEATPPGPPYPAIRLIVVDEKSGKPIPKFLAIPGFEDHSGIKGPVGSSWHRQVAVEGRDGRLDWPEDTAHFSLLLRIEANGYRPCITQALHYRDAPMTLLIKMVSDPGVDGRVISLSGKPVVRAQVGVAKWPGIRVREGRIQVNQNSEDQIPALRQTLVVETDDAGQFHLPPEVSSAIVAVTHETGYAEVRREELIGSATIELRPWGQIDGRLLWGDRPGSDEEIYCTTLKDSERDPCVAFLDFSRTDTEGRFTFDHVPPGLVRIYRVQRSAEPRAPPFDFPAVSVEVGSSGPTPVILGGKGRPVVGRMKGRDDWQGVTIKILPMELRPVIRDSELAYNAFEQSRQGSLYHRAKIPLDRDGTFRIEGVPSAAYRWQTFDTQGQRLVEGAFEIPPTSTGTSDEPFDLKVIDVAALKAAKDD